MTNIFIANLDFDITSEDLKATFSQFGEVEYAHVVYDNKTKRSKGFGYIEMPNAEEAIRAIEALNGLEVKDRKLDVKIATPKNKRTNKQERGKKAFTPKPKFSDRPKSDGPKKVMVKERRVLRPRRNRKDDNEE